MPYHEKTAQIVKCLLSAANIKRFFKFTQAFGGKITHLFLHQLNLTEQA